MRNKLPKNPYPGLRPFEFAENHLFFGREGQSEEVLRRLQESRFLAVVGTSGSGKSSLVRAGLLPLLYGGFMTEAGASWRVALFRPGDNPIHNLADALVHPTQFTSSKTAQTENSVEEENLKLAVTETVLRRSAVGLRDYANSNEFAEDENLLIVVDQFEELFRFKKENQSKVITEKSEKQEQAENEAAAFVKLLLEATKDTTKRIYVIITMRSDFLGDCSQFRDLPETINNGQYLIPRLTTEQLKKAIESPAKVKGAKIQPALVARLLNDIGDDQDQLPVLQHALMRTWDEWAKAENKETEISFEHYNTTGGMSSALSRHADEAFFELGDGDSEVYTRKQEIAEKLFKCLTETDRENRETRRATAFGKICAIADAGLTEVIEIVETFRQPGRTFLMPPQPEPLDENTLIDISHESLIRKWDRLKKWVEEEAQAAQTYRRLAEDALLHKNGRMGFWSDPELADALAWKDNFKPNETWAQLYKEKGERQYKASFADTIEYLKASEANRVKELADEKLRQDILLYSARKFRLLTYAFAVLSVFTFLFAIFAVFQWQKAVQNEQILAKQNMVMDDLNQTLNIANLTLASEKRDKDQAYENLKIQQEKTKLAYESENKAVVKAKEQTIIAQRQTKVAEEQTAKAKFSATEAEAALEQQRIFSDRSEKAAVEANEAKLKAETEAKNARLAEEAAEEARIDAENKKEIAEASKNREELNRKAMIRLEQNENEQAEIMFKNLLGKFGDVTDAQEKRGGIWWTRHNLGIVYSKLGRFEDAKDSFNIALKTLDENPIDKTVTSGSLPVDKSVFRKISFQSENEKYVSIATTLRRLAQLYRKEALIKSNDEESRELNLLSVKGYNRLFKVLGEEGPNEKSPEYSIEVYLERADVYADIKGGEPYKLAHHDYKTAENFFADRKNYIKQVEILKKRSDITTRQNYHDQALTYLKSAIKIQEKDMNLPAFSSELADSYTKAASIYNKLFESAKAVKAAEENKRKEPETTAGNEPISTDKETEQDELISQYENLSAYYQGQAESINDINFKIDRQDEFSGGYKIFDLATAYMENGNCGRTERVYTDALQKVAQVEESERMGFELKLLIERRNFYKEVKSDEVIAAEIDELIFVKLQNPSERFLSDYSQYSTNLINLAESYTKNGNFDRALTLYDSTIKKIEFFRNKVGNSERERYLLSLELRIMQNLAALFDKQGKKTETENKYKQIIFILENKSPQSQNQIVNTANYFELAGTYIDLADFYLKYEDRNSATMYFQKIADDAGTRLNDLKTLPTTNITKFYRQRILSFYVKSFYQLGKLSEKENPEVAKQFYQKAFDILKILGTEEKPSDYLRADILESWWKFLKGSEAESMKAQASAAKQKEQVLKEQQEKDKKEQEEREKEEKQQTESKPKCKENPE